MLTCEGAAGRETSAPGFDGSFSPTPGSEPSGIEAPEPAVALGGDSLPATSTAVM
ncbi:hypothetical protein D3C73_1018800 [compost metagenome]